MTLQDILCPPIPEEWKKEPYVIFEDGGFEKNEEVKPQKVINAEARDRARQRAEEYNAKRRQQTAVRLGKAQDEMRANAVKAMVESQ